MTQAYISINEHIGIDDLIFSRAKDYPQKIAYESDKIRVNYKKLESLSLSLARFFLSQQVKPREVIALSIRNDFLYLVAMLGAMKIGATLFSIPVTESTESRLEEVIQLKISKYFTDFRVESNFEWIKIPMDLFLKRVINFQVENLEKIDISWIALTSSGSTGARKIFSLTHRQQQIRNRISVETYQLTGDDRISTMSPLCYPTIKQRYLEALSIGATIVKLKENDTINAFADYNITVLFSSSMHSEKLLIGIKGSNCSLEKLRTIFIGGSEVKDSLRKRLTSEIGCDLVVRYACNETSLISSTNRDNINIPFSVGTTVEGVQVKIVNADGVECNKGVDGLILVKSLGMITKYLNEEDTIKNFCDGWFVTGDVGNINSEGVLTHKGRKDGVVIFNGINISLAEITNTALAFDYVADATTISVRHPIYQDIPVCVVQFHKSSNSMLKHFKDELRTKLGSRGPKNILEVSEIPRDSNGKIIKMDLRDLVLKLMVK
jgi:acyl-coenzyme A synthetase/AMP-(fatty) acid ligase